MPTISQLLPADHEAAYAVERISHPYPCAKAIFLQLQGKHYLNFKMQATACVGGSRSCDNGLQQYRLVGFTITQVVADEASLLNLAIHPAAQRLGYGRQLLLFLIEQLRKRAMTTLWLEVRVSNFKARALYDQLAFSEVSIRRGYYPTAEGREDALVLAKVIG